MVLASSLVLSENCSLQVTRPEDSTESETSASTAVLSVHIQTRSIPEGLGRDINIRNLLLLPPFQSGDCLLRMMQSGTREIMYHVHKVMQHF